MKLPETLLGILNWVRLGTIEGSNMHENYTLPAWPDGTFVLIITLQEVRFDTENVQD